MKYNMKNIEETLDNGTILKMIKKTLGILLVENNFICRKMNKEKITNDIHEVMKVTEEFYTKLYRSDYKFNKTPTENNAP